jgi:serine/threonine-protein phosphatase CPPED1
MKIKYLSLAIFLTLVSIAVGAQNKNSSTPFFFIQLTDPQFGMYEQDKGFSKETELYEKAVEKINRLHPDFVVITGDLVNNRNDKVQIAEFKRITAKIDKGIPVWYSPGNHDIGMPPGQNEINSFIADYGHDRFSFKHKMSLFIGLNSCIIKANSPEPEQTQFEWLKKELEKGIESDHIILFTHYPFFISAFDEPESYSNISAETRNRYLSLFEKYYVSAVYAGHLHKNISSKHGKIEFTATSSSGKPLGVDSSGFRVIKVYPDSVISVFYTLNKVPEKISLE